MTKCTLFSFPFPAKKLPNSWSATKACRWVAVDIQFQSTPCHNMYDGIACRRREGGVITAVNTTQPLSQRTHIKATLQGWALKWVPRLGEYSERSRNLELTLLFSSAHLRRLANRYGSRLRRRMWRQVPWAHSERHTSIGRTDGRKDGRMIQHWPLPYKALWPPSSDDVHTGSGMGYFKRRLF